MFNGYRVPVRLLPRITSFEVLSVLKSVFPAFMNGAKVISSYVDYDRQEEIKALTLRVLNTNKVRRNSSTQPLHLILLTAFTVSIATVSYAEGRSSYVGVHS